MPTTSKNLLIGLPASGKTTFIAALGYIVGSDEVPESLELRRLKDDTRYLSSISDNWAEFKSVDRTSTSIQEIISLQLAEPGQEEIIEVFFPDIGGEKFQEQLTDRQWESSYAELVEEASGILLMVSSTKVIDPQTIFQANASMADMDTDETDEDETAYFEKQEEKEWDGSKAPTAVELVELLQFILDAQTRNAPLRVSVVISAWDTQEKMSDVVRCPPSQWLRQRLSLLDQFLRANSQAIEFKVFGISAQGGDYNQPREVEQMQNQSRPAHRVRVYEGDAAQPSHDITRPIRWLMGNVSP